MSNVTQVGIDLAKNIFYLHGIDEKGNKVFAKKVSRDKLAVTIAHLPPCRIGMEACCGAHFWARTFQDMGHEVKLIHPKFVKPYVKTNKNDWRDAEAIVEAMGRPTMRFVAVKQIAHQDIQTLHRARSRYIRQRTAIANEIRGFLLEYGLVIPQGITHIRKRLPEILADTNVQLTPTLLGILTELRDELIATDGKIKCYDKQLEQIAQAHPLSKRLLKVPGIGVLNATILLVMLAQPHLFKCGREFAAYLGMVPRQYSSGGKQRLLGISKRGDVYTRTLLIHAGRSNVLAWRRKKELTTKLEMWGLDKAATRGYNKGCCAVANKIARSAWAMAAHEQEYQPTLLAA